MKAHEPESIAERHLSVAGEPERAIVVTIDRPLLDPTGGWACAFRVDGLPHAGGIARGTDAMQALLMALEGARVRLRESGLTFRFGGEETLEGGLPRMVSRPSRAAERTLEWLLMAHDVGCAYLAILYQALAHGAPIGIEPSAWENTLTAVEWAVTEARAERVQWTKRDLTEEDVERVRTLRQLGVTALTRGERSPALVALTEACLEMLAGPKWRSGVAEMAKWNPWMTWEDGA